MESPIILFVAVIWFLRLYQGGKYCDKDENAYGYFPMDTGEYGLDDVNGFLFDTWGGDYANIEN